MLVSSDGISIESDRLASAQRVAAVSRAGELDISLIFSITWVKATSVSEAPETELPET
jgi:hypothetical protein